MCRAVFVILSSPEAFFFGSLENTLVMAPGVVYMLQVGEAVDFDYGVDFK